MYLDYDLRRAKIFHQTPLVVSFLLKLFIVQLF